MPRIKADGMLLVLLMLGVYGMASGLPEGPVVRAGAAHLRSLIRSGKKVVAAGKNYAEHNAEMAKIGILDAQQDEYPAIFLKPTTAIAWPGMPIRFPTLPWPHERKLGIQHEVELGVIIGKECKQMSEEASAMGCVGGYVLGLDITDRDRMAAAKARGMPWTVAKGFDSFLPVSEPFVPNEGLAWSDLEFWLAVNGEERQRVVAGKMVHPVPKILKYISQIMTLEPGDIVLTGTPRGVATLNSGDRITAGVEDHVEMSVDVLAERRRRKRPSACADAERRRLVAQPLVAAEAGESDGEDFYVEWRDRFECWYTGLAIPTQHKLVGECLGALALHLGTRMDATWKAAQATLGRTAAASSAAVSSASVSAAAGCEWVGEALEGGVELPALPEFPPIPQSFQLPPIPANLVPDWRHLQSLSKQQLQRARAAARPWTAAAASAGVALAASIGLALMMSHRTRTRRARVTLKLRQHATSATESGAQQLRGAPMSTSAGTLSL